MRTELKLSMGTKTPVAITHAGPSFGRTSIITLRTSIITLRTSIIHSVITVAVEQQNRALWCCKMLRSFPSTSFSKSRLPRISFSVHSCTHVVQAGLRLPLVFTTVHLESTIVYKVCILWLYSTFVHGTFCEITSSLQALRVPCAPEG